MFLTKSRSWLIAALIGAAFLASCSSSRNSTAGTLSSSSSNAAKALTPAGTKPAWAPTISDNMQVVIEKLQSYGNPPIETLPAAEACKQPTPAKAVMDVQRDYGIVPAEPMVLKTERTIPVTGGSLPARIYTPKSGAQPFPVIVYYHGGGWVIADLDTYDASAQALAEKIGAIVISAHYRQAPEYKFPTAHNDAFEAYQWTLANAASIGGDPSRIAVAGESAGGNLACNVSIMARDQKIQMPVAQLLVYPIANNNMSNDSYTRYADAKPLNKPMMGWFLDKYLNSANEAADPRISLVRANLRNLPPTVIVGAQIDPLHDEGQKLYEQLDRAGVRTKYRSYTGVTHEFFGMSNVVPQAGEAQDMAADFLKKRLF